MRLLLDENLPHGLKNLFDPKMEVITVQEMGWSGKNDSDLLTFASQHGFDYLITIDKNLRHQQNLNRFAISLIVLMAVNNRYPTLKSLAELANQTLLDGVTSKWTEVH